MKPAAVLDIGSSKVVCLCGSMADGDGIVVHGAGVCTYEGYRDGAFIDKQSLHNAVVEALQKAEQESRIRIRDVALTVPAAFSDLLLTDATLSLGKPRKTEAADIDRLIALSLEKCKKKPGYTLMHSTPVFFLVDGVSSTEVPEGITTDEISALISHMFVQEAYIRTVQESLDDMGVEISMCVSAQLGESVMLIPEKERVRPAVLIDVGYHQTEISVVENTALTAISTLPIGGYQFASDLSFGLDVPMDAAEQAKRRYVFSLDLQEKAKCCAPQPGAKGVPVRYLLYNRGPGHGAGRNAPAGDGKYGRESGCTAGGICFWRRAADDAGRTGFYAQGAEFAPEAGYALDAQALLAQLLQRFWGAGLCPQGQPAPGGYDRKRQRRETGFAVKENKRVLHEIKGD